MQAAKTAFGIERLFNYKCCTPTTVVKSCKNNLTVDQVKRMWPGPFLEDNVINSIGMLHSIQMLAIVLNLFYCNCSYVIM